jgi:hypothetical protein
MKPLRPVLVGLLLATAGCGGAVVSLPDNVRVQAPASTVPQNAAAFSGMWQGVWDGELPHVLVVEEVTSDGASVIYAWGDSTAWDRQAGYWRVKGTISDNVLVVKLERPATVTYRMQSNGTLDASYEWSGAIARATMRKVVQ